MFDDKKEEAKVEAVVEATADQQTNVVTEKTKKRVKKVTEPDPFEESISCSIEEISKLRLANPKEERMLRLKDCIVAALKRKIPETMIYNALRNNTKTMFTGSRAYFSRYVKQWKEEAGIESKRTAKVKSKADEGAVLPNDGAVLPDEEAKA